MLTHQLGGSENYKYGDHITFDRKYETRKLIPEIRERYGTIVDSYAPVDPRYMSRFVSGGVMILTAVTLPVAGPEVGFPQQIHDHRRQNGSRRFGPDPRRIGRIPIHRLDEDLDVFGYPI